jgi:predicted metalloprotease
MTSGSRCSFASLAVALALSFSVCLQPAATQTAQPTQGDAQAAVAEGIEKGRSMAIPVPNERRLTRGSGGSLAFEPKPAANPSEYGSDMALAIRALDEYWAEALPNSFKRQYRTPAKLYQYIPAKGDQGFPCGKQTPGPRNAIYCPMDDSIQWDGNFLYGLYKEFGDFAPALVLAHEWGHAVQQRLGLLSTASYTIERELQADCLAGAWTRYAEVVQKILEPGDIDEGIRTLFEVRDKVGTPWFDPSAHGTGQQRIRSFNGGYDAPNGARACVR